MCEKEYTGKELALSDEDGGFDVDIIGSEVLSIGVTKGKRGLGITFKSKDEKIHTVIFGFDETGMWVESYC